MGVWECSTGQWAEAICSAGKAWVRPVKLNSRYFSISVSLRLLLSILPPCQKSKLNKQGQLYFESYSRHAWRDSLRLCCRGTRPPSCSGGFGSVQAEGEVKENLQNKLKKWRNPYCERQRQDRKWTRLGLIRTHRQFSHGFWAQRTAVGVCNCFEVSVIRKTRGEFPLPSDQPGPFIKGVVWL